jgi:hypothetical protein
MIIISLLWILIPLVAIREWQRECAHHTEDEIELQNQVLALQLKMEQYLARAERAETGLATANKIIADQRHELRRKHRRCV